MFLRLVVEARFDASVQTLNEQGGTEWHCAECFEGEGKTGKTGKVKQKSHGRSGSKAKDGKGGKTKETKAKGAGKASLKELCCSAFCTIFVLS